MSSMVNREGVHSSPCAMATRLQIHEFGSLQIHRSPLHSAFCGIFMPSQVHDVPSNEAPCGQNTFPAWHPWLSVQVHCRSWQFHPVGVSMATSPQAQAPDWHVAEAGHVASAQVHPLGNVQVHFGFFAEWLGDWHVYPAPGSEAPPHIGASSMHS